MHRLILKLAGPVSWILTSCVSVNLGGPSEPRRAQARFQSPASPFEKVESVTTDHAWKSTKTGSIISYLSDCSPAADLTLETMRDEALNALGKSKVQTQVEIRFQDREALRAILTGEVDGVETKIDLLIFKKNSCSYNISLISLPSYFEKDSPAFNSFLSGFFAP